MRFFDVNCMIGEWGFEELKFKTADELLVQMDILNISRAMVFHSRSWQCDLKTGNESIVGAVCSNERLLPVIVLSPLIQHEFGGREKLLGFMEKNNVCGVRLFPIDQNYTLQPWNIGRLFKLMNEVRMPVLIECRQMKGSIDTMFNEIYTIAGEYPDVPVILLAPGYRSLRVLYELLDACSNIHIDTSTFITYHGIEETVETFGSERLLFGTRMPFMEGGVSVGRVIYSGINAEDKENIAHRNIERLLDRCLLKSSLRKEVRK